MSPEQIKLANMKTIYVVIAGKKGQAESEATVRAFPLYKKAMDFIGQLEQAKKGFCDLPCGLNKSVSELEFFDYFYISSVDFDDDAEAD